MNDQEKGRAPAGTEAPTDTRKQQTKGSLARRGGEGKPPNGARGLALLEDYDPKDFNVLHPVMLTVEGHAVSPVLTEAVSVVRINPDPKAGDVYNDSRYAPRGQKGAPTAQALAKIATAAGIQWDTRECRPIGRQVSPAGHIYVAYQAVGRIRQLNGEWHAESATADIDTAVAEEEFRETYQRKVDKGWNKDRKTGNVTFTEKDIPEMVRREVLQLKKFALRHAETKAKSRVIRRLLSLKQTYTNEDLAKPFVVPRLLHRPDVAEAIEQGRQAVVDIYAPPAEVPELEGEIPEEPTEGNEDVGAEPARQEPTLPAAGQGEAPAPSGEPRDDPMIEDEGPYKGERMSRVAELDPGYLEAMSTMGRTKRLRELAAEWLAFAKPEQQTLEGDES